MFLINPKAYYGGNGTGSSIVAESYCCGGLFGTVFWPFVYMYLFILLWERHHKKLTLFSCYCPAWLSGIIPLGLIRSCSC